MAGSIGSGGVGWAGSEILIPLRVEKLLSPEETYAGVVVGVRGGECDGVGDDDRLWSLFFVLTCGGRFVTSLTSLAELTRFSSPSILLKPLSDFSIETINFY